MPLWECIVKGQCLGQGRSRERLVTSRDALPQGQKQGSCPCAAREKSFLWHKASASGQAWLRD